MKIDIDIESFIRRRAEEYAAAAVEKTLGITVNTSGDIQFLTSSWLQNTIGASLKQALPVLKKTAKAKFRLTAEDARRLQSAYHDQYVRALLVQIGELARRQADKDSKAVFDLIHPGVLADVIARGEDFKAAQRKILKEMKEKQNEKGKGSAIR